MAQIKSPVFICHIKQHFMTINPLVYVINGLRDFVKCYIKRCVHLDLQPDNMLFGGLQPIGICVSNERGVSILKRK